MRVPESQESNVGAEESPLKKSANAFSSFDAVSNTARYFEAWLRDLKPAFDLNETAAVQPASRTEAGSFSADALRFEGTLRIDCRVVGKLRSLNSTLVVGESGQVEGDIDAAVAVIEGEVRGNIRATDRIEIGSRASVIGNIQAASISIQPGAVFEGRCIFLSSQPPSKIEVSRFDSNLKQRPQSVRDKEERQEDRLFVAVGK